MLLIQLLKACFLTSTFLINYGKVASKRLIILNQVNNKNYINEPQDPKDVILAV